MMYGWIDAKLDTKVALLVIQDPIGREYCV